MSRKRLELILLDAAGTLIEPAEPVELIYQRYFAAAGWPADAAELKRGFRQTFAGLGMPAFSGEGRGDEAERAWWRRVVEQTALSVGIDPDAAGFDRCFDGLFDYYARGSAWAVFPEVPGLLKKWREDGRTLAVVSNFDRRLHRVLDELGLAGSFDLILTSADVSARKPSPKLLEEAMRHFSAGPETSCLAGDGGDADGGAARAAGVEVFILNRPRTSLLDFEKWLDEDFY